jgi:AAA ATPase domain
MATVTMRDARGPETAGEPGAPGADARAVAFCTPDLPDPFHAFAYASEVWKPDPFDVGSIHRGAREVLRRLVGTVRQPSGVAVGRILLMLGEAGCGKTHLMRAFRNELHSRGQGYVGYMQMTAYTDDYGRYVLNNLVESLDKPYDEARPEISGLMRLSNAVAEACRAGGASAALDVPDALERIREGAAGQPELDDLVRGLADRIAPDARFASIDYDMVQALLYLQAPSPRVKATVLKYLRCEDLTPHDRRDLGGLFPRTYASAPQWVIQRLGDLMWAVEKVPLVLCVDQLEDMFDLGEAPARFRRVLATLCDITSRLPSAIVVISCLENFFDEVKRHLTQPISRRVTAGPGPVELPAACDRDQVVALIGRRLESLYRSAGVRYHPDEPTHPLPDALVRRLVGLGARDVLDEVRRYRERCIAKGKMVEYPPDGGTEAAGPSRELDRKIVAIEQAWNEARSSAAIVVPSDEAELAAILAGAIGSCTGELGALGGHFEAEADGRFVQAEHHGVGGAVGRFLVGVCNKGPQAGALSRQIDEIVQRAGGITPVVVRSTAFPGSPKAAVVQQLNRLVADGGRRAVVEDSDWRTMMALTRFRAGREADPVFAAWLGRTRPLTSLAALRTILGLNAPDAPQPGGGEPAGTGSHGPVVSSS